MTGFEDWMPTLLDIAGLGAKVPPATDGVSFAPTLLGKSQPARAFLYREFPAYGGQQCIRVGDWKLIRENLMPNKKKGLKPTTELYDLGADPHEEHDVAAEHADVVARLMALLQQQHTPSKQFPFAAIDK